MSYSPDHPWIRINGSRVYLDADRLQRGEAAKDPDSLSEQCVGCGEDIAETMHRRRHAPGAIFCTCGTSYAIRRG